MDLKICLARLEQSICDERSAAHRDHRVPARCGAGSSCAYSQLAEGSTCIGGAPLPPQPPTPTWSIGKQAPSLGATVTSHDNRLAATQMRTGIDPDDRRRRGEDAASAMALSSVAYAPRGAPRGAAPPPLGAAGMAPPELGSPARPQRQG